jgi:hypothetical protein
MITNPVESSFLSRVGFDRAAGVLRVEFRDGTVLFRQATAELFCEFMAAESKGKFWHARLKAGPEPAAVEGENKRQNVTTEKKPPAPLQTFDHDPCCSSRLAAAIKAGELDAKSEWPCPKCGTDWKAKVIDATAIGDSVWNVMKHWTPAPYISVFNRRRQ